MCNLALFPARVNRRASLRARPARQRLPRGAPNLPARRCKRWELDKVGALFAELKQRIRLYRVPLRRLWNLAEQFLLAATAQKLKRLVRFVAQRRVRPELSTA